VPPLPAQPNVLALKHMFTIGADIDVATKFHFTYTGGPPTDADCVAIATAMMGAAVIHLVPILGTDNALTGISVTDLTTPTSGYGEYLLSTGGSRGGAPLPAGACVLQNLPIARRYRGGKPRLYWPFGIASDLTSPQLWSPTAMTDFETAISAYLVSVGTTTVGTTVFAHFVSISNYEGFTAVTNPITGRTRDVPKVRPVAIAPDPILATNVINPRVGSQRRRNLHST